MQTTFIIASLFAAAAVAAPTMESRQVYDPCSGLYDTPLCCATDVLGVADLDCVQPGAVLTEPAQFQSTCADAGQRARCCVLPILGQAVLCQTPAGVVY